MTRARGGAIGRLASASGPPLGGTFAPPPIGRWRRRASSRYGVGTPPHTALEVAHGVGGQAGPEGELPWVTPAVSRSRRSRVPNGNSVPVSS